MRAYPRVRSRQPWADEEILAPLEVFAAASGPRPNAARKRWSVDPFRPFEGREDLTVRTVLLRHPGYQAGRPAPKVTCSRDAADLCSHLAAYDQEHVAVLALDSQNNVRAIYELAIGPSTAAPIVVADVVKIPLLSGCAAFVLAHNHPGGNPEPSRQDMVLTEKIIEAARCLQLTLVDHVIITMAGYTSLLDRGLVSLEVA